MTHSLSSLLSHQSRTMNDGSKIFLRRNAFLGAERSQSRNELAPNHFVSGPPQTTMPSAKKNLHSVKAHREYSDQLSNLPLKKTKLDPETMSLPSQENELKPSLCVWNWSVRNSDLHTKEKIVSPKMTFPGSSYHFEIWLIPKAPIMSIDEPKCVSLHLNLIEPSVAEITYQLTVMKNGNHLFQFSSQHVFGPKQYNAVTHGNEKFVEFELFQKRLDQVASLSEQFTIRCEVTRFKTPVSLKRSLKIDESLMEYFKDEKFGDVKIVVEDRILRAHELVLIDASRVFHLLINSDEKVLNILNTCYETMLQVLLFIYSGRVGALNDTRVTDIYLAAKRYELGRLKKICEDYMCQNLSINKVFDFLHFSELHNLEALKERAQALLISQRRHLGHMTDPELFKNIMSVSRETLVKILSGIIRDTASCTDGVEPKDRAL